MTEDQMHWVGILVDAGKERGQVQTWALCMYPPPYMIPQKSAWKSGEKDKPDQMKIAWKWLKYSLLPTLGEKKMQ